MEADYAYVIMRGVDKMDCELPKVGKSNIKWHGFKV